MGHIYDLGGNGIWVFILVTCLLGGAGAYHSGRAMAQTWRPWWQVPLYMLGIAASVRFIHYALFTGPLLSAPSLVVDYIVTVVAASAGYRIVRAGQMGAQYGWLFERAGPLGWRRRA
ncbi:MAG: DUF6867 family protein [Hyphomicrobiaceae bacterium]